MDINSIIENLKSQKIDVVEQKKKVSDIVRKMKNILDAISSLIFFVGVEGDRPFDVHVSEETLKFIIDNKSTIDKSNELNTQIVFIYYKFISFLKTIETVNDIFYNQFVGDALSPRDLFVSESIDGFPKSIKLFHELKDLSNTYTSNIDDINSRISDSRKINDQIESLISIAKVLKYQTKLLSDEDKDFFSKIAVSYLDDDEIDYCSKLFDKNAEICNANSKEEPKDLPEKPISNSSKIVTNYTSDYFDEDKKLKKQIINDFMLIIKNIEEKMLSRKNYSNNNRYRISIKIASILGEMNSFNLNNDDIKELKDYISEYKDSYGDFSIIDATIESESVYKFIILSELSKALDREIAMDNVYCKLIGVFMKLKFVSLREKFSVVGNEKYSEVCKLIEETVIDEDYNKLKTCYDECCGKSFEYSIDYCRNIGCDVNDFLLFSLKNELNRIFNGENIYTMEQSEIDDKMNKIISTYEYALNGKKNSQINDMTKLFNSNTKHYVVVLNNDANQTSFVDQVRDVAKEFNYSSKIVSTHLYAIANSLEYVDIKSNHYILMDGHRNDHDIKSYKIAGYRLGLYFAKDVRYNDKPIIMIMGAVSGDFDGNAKRSNLIELYDGFVDNWDIVKDVENQFKISQDQGYLTERAQQYLSDTEEIYKQLDSDMERKNN